MQIIHETDVQAGAATNWGTICPNATPCVDSPDAFMQRLVW
jgi:hypothetical protein